MSLLEIKNNNSGIKQLNQISEFIENKNENDNNTQIDNNINEKEEEDEEDEEEEEEENDEDKNNSSEKDNYSEENEEEEIDEENLSLLSLYKYRLNYEENIYLYPRPKTNIIKYKNSQKENTYISDPSNTDSKPSVFAYFTNIEDTNSSLKLIRPSQYIIPHNINNFSDTLNLFGLNIEPFSLDEKQNNFEFIEKINLFIDNDDKRILRCSNCNSIYHKLNYNLELITGDNYYQHYKYLCYICKKYDEFYMIKSCENNKYEKNIDKRKIFYIPELISYKPSIEYIIEYKNENRFIRNIIQIIILDLSNKDFVNFIYQELNEIISNTYDQYEKDINKNEYKIYYILIAYYHNEIYYIYINKLNKTINISIMRDFKNPFCPIEPIKLFCSAKEFLDLLGNFYYHFFSSESFQNKNITSFNNIDIDNNIIKSIFNLIKMNKINEDIKFYYHLIFLSSSNCDIKLDLFKENKIYNIFLSFFLVSKKTNKNIPFINSLDIHNIKFYYFPIEYEDATDITQKHQEIKRMLIKALNIQNYLFDIQLNICYDKKIFKNISNNDIINISFFPNKTSLNKIYLLPQIGKPSPVSSIYVQYNIEYFTFIDKFKFKHIRVLTFMNKISKEPLEVYNSFDEEVLFRIVLSYHLLELNLSKNNFNSINKLYTDIINKNDTLFSNIIKTIIKKIKITFARNYKNGKEKKGIFISRPKLFSLYFYSFIKQISEGHNLNLFNLIYDCKIKPFMKSIYPNLLSLGYLTKAKKEKFYLHPLSFDFFDRTQLLLLDNGFSIILLINTDINDEIKEHYLTKEKDSDINMIFKAESNIINDIIKNRTIKYIELNDKIILNKKILNIFIEDRIIENINEEIDNEPKFELSNEYIQNDISYSDFYRIVTKNIFEFFDN